MAARCADQLLVLSCGRIAACGSPQQVLTATTIKQVFNVDVSIGINPLTGTPLVIA
jgi:iron complex transport system ATP-binding protein